MNYYRREIQRVVENILPDGKWVSTVRLPESSFHRNFETMVFRSRDSLGEIDCAKYDTEDEAMAGHEAMIRKWSIPSL